MIVIFYVQIKNKKENQAAANMAAMATVVKRPSGLPLNPEENDVMKRKMTITTPVKTRRESTEANTPQDINGCHNSQPALKFHVEDESNF